MAKKDIAPWFAWLVLIIGVLYLLGDLGTFAMSLEWYTLAFLLLGIKFLTH
ncbi:hypothetical protein KY337_01090 [Candidatus Woesearchaeota archaeon]|nr:hypothetical protein [Candidatus Woesearchaeota archaeon]